MSLTEIEAERLIGKLKDHIQFIQRSCEDYDRGSENESLRIATSLRVIFHNTNASVSLISHLGFDLKEMLTSSRGHEDWKDYLALRENLNSPELIIMIPMLGNEFRKISIEDWWEKETVFKHNSKNHSRRKIILSIANKDGGAHVDKELEKYYEFLCSGEYALGITGNLEYNGPPPFPQGITIYAKNAHLALIRQFAHEFLASVNYFKWLTN